MTKLARFLIACLVLLPSLASAEGGGYASPRPWLAVSFTEQVTQIPAGAFTGGGTAIVVPITIPTNGIGVTSTNALILSNSTAAAAGAQQMSGQQCFNGNGWKTDATAGSQAVSFCNEMLPVQGAAAPTANLLWKYAVNGGAYGTILTLSSAGVLTTAGNLISGSNVLMASSGSLIWSARGVVTSPAESQFNLLNQAQSAGVGFDAATDGVLSLRTRAQTGPGRLLTAYVVEANTGAKAPTEAETRELYTNTGDADGSSVGLPNDPTVGVAYYVAVTAAQTITITAAAGETLKFGTSTCGTSLTSNSVGSAVLIVAATGGSGAIWVTMASTGSWTCNA